MTATGAALAALHAQVPEGLVCWTPEATIADVLSLSVELGFICPELARRADKLARGFSAQLAGGPARQCTIHGDFTAKQVLVDQQEVAIIDLDWAGRGDPVGDCTRRRKCSDGLASRSAPANLTGHNAQSHCSKGPRPF